jgi:hypothetical protein
MTKSRLAERRFVEPGPRRLGGQAFRDEGFLVMMSVP